MCIKPIVSCPRECCYRPSEHEEMSVCPGGQSWLLGGYLSLLVFLWLWPLTAFTSLGLLVRVICQAWQLIFSERRTGMDCRGCAHSCKAHRPLKWPHLCSCREWMAAVPVLLIGQPFFPYGKIPCLTHEDQLCYFMLSSFWHFDKVCDLALF